MSFDFSPNINLSNVQASHKTTDGGGGNTAIFNAEAVMKNHKHSSKKKTHLIVSVCPLKQKNKMKIKKVL